MWWKRKFQSNTRYLYRFLKQNYGSISPSFIEIIADRSREIRTIKVFGTEFNSSGTNDASQRLSQSINFVNSELQNRVISLLSKKKDYYILFDQLDLGWDNTEETKQLMIGLILSARDVIRAAEQKGKNLHLVIFLRSDIYETLRFEDKNKISPDVVELRWDENRLKDLASKRIETSAGGTWEDLFTGDTMRQQLSQLSYIVRRTMLRPRDMIQYCIFAKDAAAQADKASIDREDIYNAERPYSDYVRKEIQDETNALPIKIDTLFSIIQDIRSMRVPKEQFIEVCREKGIDDAEEALDLLIDLSVLGVYRTGGKERGSTIIYKYQARPWDTLEPSPTLAVHPSLRHAFSLVENRSAKKTSVNAQDDSEEEE